MEPLKHECGVAMIRLLKPLKYYQEKYGTWMYGINKLYLMMEKQHNRGQEGAGLCCVKTKAPQGSEYLFRERAEGNTAISEIFGNVRQSFLSFPKKLLNDADYAEADIPFAGQIYMGHLRYSTTGKSGLSYVHPFLRRQCWKATSLCICGNFNITNVDEIFHHITSHGQHPRIYADTHILLEQLGHRLDRENERLFVEARQKGLDGLAVTDYIEEHIDINNMFRTAAPLWDGGYVLCAATGSGEMSVLRDPWGIRPAFWYKDDEIMVLASERPVIQTAFSLPAESVRELEPGQSITISKGGNIRLKQILPRGEVKPCSFERIYFSRGSDRDIYLERKALGAQLLEPILKAVDGDVDHTVFSYIPNTAESAFFGMIEAFDGYLNREKMKAIQAEGGALTNDRLKQILNRRVRSEKVAWKDIKMRTFIAEGNSRNDLAAHVYDITYGSLEENVDNLVIIDDSIVRGTTLKESIIRILDRLKPRRIVVVSSAPQIRYPDYYGIDMSRLEEFIVFRAAIALLQDRGMESRIMDVYERCLEQLKKSSKEEMQNCVRLIYEPFSDEDLSEKMAQMLSSKDTHAEIRIVFQTIDGLHKACPRHPGDWYFSGDYPTKGGVKRVNEAYVNYVKNIYLKDKETI